MRESLLDARTYEAVGLFDLSISLRVRYGGETDLNALISTELLELFGCEVCSVVGDYAVRCAKPTGYPLE